ncbi:adenylyltransferase and sulfurtransferase MOCS3 isoform X2 [Pseudophryne corroboree]|uniref:adenylyltransferase and sulfurtransferase MOCS3 isoform X2 n=1 Tax=Pseudophryne corroboree TaxID=495146 RepID=UPI003081464F
MALWSSSHAPGSVSLHADDARVSISMDFADMDSAVRDGLREEIRRKDAEIQMLKEQLAASHQRNKQESTVQGKGCSSLVKLHTADDKLDELTKASLSNPDILRYSRQLVLPEFGVKGRLGLLDYDVVEMSNLHRQVLHGVKRQGISKAVSVVKTLRKLNPSVDYVPYQMMLNPGNALQLIQQYNVIADCSDNVPTRYLVNDACVTARKPLVSASALRWEGQLTVYNYQNGPCYRCLFPVPPPSETVTNCADGGVLGIVPGIMGCIQALEVLKIASGMSSSYSGIMLMYDALDGRFRNIKIRGKKPDCAVCSCNSKCQILENYEEFCGSPASDKCRTLNLLSSDERLTVQDYKQILDKRFPHLLIDVRPQPEVEICRLGHSVHIPLSQMEDKNITWIDFLNKSLAEINSGCNELEKRVIVICKLGNDSQKAVKILQRVSGKETEMFTAKDIKGGLMAWSEKIDLTFPQY